MKRAGLGILALLISLTVFVSPVLALEDMNGDNVINVLDLVLSKNPMIIAGDTDANGDVNIFDLATVGLCYGCDFEQDCWSNCEQADVANTVDEIDIFDLATVGLNYNKQFPESEIDPIFTVSPSTSDMKVGQNASIDITIETIPAEAEVYAVELVIYFDKDVITAESATEAGFLKQGGTMTFPVITIDNTNGKIIFASTRFGTLTGANGSGTLVNLIFSGKAAGSSHLNIDDILVSDPLLQPMTLITANNGSANVVLSDKPVISQVSDDSSAASLTNVGQDVTFTVDWSDNDSTQARTYICSSTSIDSSGCSDTTFCSTTNSATDPQSCQYTAQQADASTENYWARVCDDLNVCSDLSGPHTFHVNHAPVVNVPDQAVNEDTAPPANWVDLWSYTADPEDSDSTLTYALISQSNSGLISCSLSGNRYINCNTPAQDQSGFSDLTVRATDPNGLQDQDTFRVTVNPVNDLPTQPGVDVTPDSPYTNNNLLCTITTPSQDADTDPITYSYAWYKNGNLQGGLITNTVGSANTARGETWKCKVTPNDGTGDGPAGEDQVTILNTLPTAPVVDVTPDSPVITDDLLCTITTPSQDADSDGITYSYAWYKDTVLQPGLTTNTVPAANTAKNQVWNCKVTPNDGTADGASGDDEVVVGNTAPVASGLAISPTSPKTTDNLVGSYTYTDADGDPESGSEIRWYKNSVLQPAYNDQLTIPSSATSKGQEWYFTVKPRDGLGFGALETSPVVTILNTAPGAPVVDVTPNLPLTTNNLVCSITTPSQDADSDGITYSYAWGKDGVLQPGLTTDTVDSANTARGETWNCKVTPNDGTDDGPAGEDEVTIQNSHPSIDSFNPLTDPAIDEYQNQPFSIIKSDADLVDVLTVTWYLDGAVVGAGDSYTFVTDHQSSGTYQVKVEVTDGTETVSHAWTLTVQETHQQVIVPAGQSIFSLPRKPVAPLTFNTLGSDCTLTTGGTTCTGVNLVYMNATTGNYTCISKDDQFNPGQGYFITVQNQCSFVMSGDKVEAGDLGYNGQLYNGWNIMGAPAVNTSFLDIIPDDFPIARMNGDLVYGVIAHVYNIASCAAFAGYNGYYQQCDTKGGIPYCYCDTYDLNPGKGYFVFSDNVRTLG